MLKKLNRNNRYQFPLLYVGLKKTMIYTEILSKIFLIYNAVNFAHFFAIISMKKKDNKSCQREIFTALVIVIPISIHHLWSHENFIVENK